jgi:hypothetical protein
VTITLKIKNVASKPITLAAVTPPITIGAGKEAEVPLDAVRGGDFGEQLAGGHLTLSPDGLAALSAPARASVVQALGDVILRVASRFVAHHVALSSALAQLGALRDRYNELHAASVKLLGEARGMAPGLKAVVAVIELADHAEEGAVAAAEKAVRDHLQAVPKDAATLETWYREHQQLEAVAASAKAARTAAQSALSRQLEATRTDLLSAATAFDKADPAKDIGARVTWGP